MNNHRLFSGMGGAIAVVCILFLPVVGCGNQSATGLQIVENKQFPSNIQFFIEFAIAAGLVCIFLKHIIAAIAASIAGFVSLLVAYTLAHSKLQGIELKAGAYFALLGFALTAIINFLRISDTSRKENGQ